LLDVRKCASSLIGGEQHSYCRLLHLAPADPEVRRR